MRSTERLQLQKRTQYSYMEGDNHIPYQYSSMTINNLINKLATTEETLQKQRSERTKLALKIRELEKRLL